MSKSKTVAKLRTTNERSERPSSDPPSQRRLASGRGEVELTDVVAFVRVVDAGSFTRAASGSVWPKSALSRRVARLEHALGVRLLQRTTRSLGLTDAGAAYHARASAALAQLSEARECATHTTQDPSGVVRITVPVDMGTGAFSAVLTQFAQRYPKIHVEVDLSPRMVDLVAEGFDLAVRAGRLRDSSLVAKRLGHSPLIVVGSPDYLARHGRPKRPADLEQHACVLFRASKGEMTWKLENPRDEQHTVKVHGPLSGSDFSFVRAAAIAGAGLALLPALAVTSDVEAGKLEWLLQSWVGPSSPVHLVYPSARFVPQRVAVLRDFLTEHLHFGCPSEMSLAR